MRSLAKILNQAVTAQLGNQVTKVRADDVTFAPFGQQRAADEAVEVGAIPFGIGRFRAKEL